MYQQPAYISLRIEAEAQELGQPQTLDFAIEQIKAQAETILGTRHFNVTSMIFDGDAWTAEVSVANELIQRDPEELPAPVLGGPPSGEIPVVELPPTEFEIETPIEFNPIDEANQDFLDVELPIFGDEQEPEPAIEEPVTDLRIPNKEVIIESFGQEIGSVIDQFENETGTTVNDD